MSQFLEFSLLGLTTGGAYALIALGLVAVYRGTGVVNFAQGAIGMASTYAFWKLYAHAGVPLWAAVVLGLAVGALIGVVFYAFVGRRLIGASATTKTLVTLGLLLMLQAVVRIFWTNQQERVDSVLFPGATRIAGTPVPDLSIALVVTATLLTLALHGLFRYTRFGRVTTALQDSPMGAQSLGYSPHPWGACAWAISGVLAAAAGILLAPVTALSPNALSTLVIPALGAALIAAFRHFWIALPVGLLAGLVESLAIGFGVAPGVGKSLPYAVTLLALVIAGRHLPGRGTVDAPRLFRVGSGHVSWPGIAVGAALVVTAATALPDQWSDTLALTAIFALVGLSVVVSTGYAGQISLLPLALAALSMLFAGWVSQRGASLPLTLALATGAAGVAGGVIGGVTARLRGIGMTIATLAITAIVETGAFTSSRLVNDVTGWTVRDMSVLGLSFDNAVAPQRFALLAWALVLAAGLLLAALRRSAAGRRLLAARSDERGAAASGVSVPRAKQLAMTVAAALAGLAGALLALQGGTVGGQRFGEGFLYADSLALISMTVLSGAGYLVGGVLTGVFVPGGLLAQWLSFGPRVNDWLALLLAANLVFVLLGEPDGVVAQFLRGAARLGLAPRHGHRHRSTAPNAAACAAPPDRAALVHTLRPRLPGGANAAALQVDHLSVRYGHIVVVDDVSLTIRPGEVLGVLGPNGAGKSSLIDAITGFVPIRTGEVRVSGAALDALAPHARVARGLTRTFQDHLLFEDLTVRENLLAAADVARAQPRPRHSVSSAAAAPGAVVAAAAALTGTDTCLDQIVAALSLGWHARVTLARALAARASVLCLDEPAAALSPEARRHVIDAIRAAARELGIAILLVEHNMDVVLATCDTVIVMDAGRVIAQGPPAEVLRRPEVIRAYLGEPSPDVAPAGRRNAPPDPGRDSRPEKDRDAGTAAAGPEAGPDAHSAPRPVEAGA
ncbi:ATP-binding cassette domain-containing protein [Robbsia sp. Bb-Pol-6]|uniref:ATP-binding cassette domain-containing protein n=1 Tax=Robbsia betulipollinis TaxID=2981849 RepID=A0ABT3ZJX8_9BURK|nr:ATP-binding cassette domain-containing protein [Robbsia betulipollinis]MCY0386722.1 ATP-binding cassette domain-containing protein [Robbsia betulipollinis]